MASRESYIERNGIPLDNVKEFTEMRIKAAIKVRGMLCSHVEFNTFGQENMEQDMLCEFILKTFEWSTLGKQRAYGGEYLPETRQD